MPVISGFRVRPSVGPQEEKLDISPARPRDSRDRPPAAGPLRVLLQHPLILALVSRRYWYIKLGQFIVIFFPIRGSRIIEQDSCGLRRRRCRDYAVGIAALKGDKYQLPWASSKESVNSGT